jgi:hypothetical protein
MAVDLTAAADANGPGRRAASAAAIASDASGRLAAFRDLTAGSAFATNVFAAKIVSYDACHQIVPSGSAATIDRHDKWRSRREAFEAVWDHGDRFVYGAVNAGGVGVESFGLFCIVVPHPEASTPAALAVFPSDSAQRYTTPDATVVEPARAQSEATAWGDRADMAVTEKAAEALATVTTPGPRSCATTTHTSRWYEPGTSRSR